MAKQSVSVVETAAGFSFEFNGKTYTYSTRKTAEHMAKALPRGEAQRHGRYLPRRRGVRSLPLRQAVITDGGGGNRP